MKRLLVFSSATRPVKRAPPGYDLGNASPTVKSMKGLSKKTKVVKREYIKNKEIC